MALLQSQKKVLDNCFSQHTEIVLHPLSRVITINFDYTNQQQCKQIPHGLKFTFQFDNDPGEYPFIYKQFEYGVTPSLDFHCATCSFFQQTTHGEFIVESQVFTLKVVVGAISKVFAEGIDCFETMNNIVWLDQNTTTFTLKFSPKCAQIDPNVQSVEVMLKFRERNTTDYSESLSFNFIQQNSSHVVFSLHKEGWDNLFFSCTLQWVFLTLRYPGYNQPAKIHHYRNTGLPQQYSDFHIIFSGTGLFLKTETFATAPATNEWLSQQNVTNVVNFFISEPHAESEQYGFSVNLEIDLEQIYFENGTTMLPCSQFVNLEECTRKFTKILEYDPSTYRMWMEYWYFQEDGTFVAYHAVTLNGFIVSSFEEISALYSGGSMQLSIQSSFQGDIPYQIEYYSNYAQNQQFFQPITSNLTFQTVVFDNYTTVDQNAYLLVKQAGVLVDAALVDHFMYDHNQLFNNAAFSIIGGGLGALIVAIIAYEIANKHIAANLKYKKRLKQMDTDELFDEIKF